MPTGGCFCGGIRYEAADAPFHETNCHCSICRRTTGAPFVTWFSVRRSRFTLVRGEPSRFKSTAKGLRSFCPQCGTQLTFEHEDFGDEIDVTSVVADAVVDPVQRSGLPFVCASATLDNITAQRLGFVFRLAPPQSYGRAIYADFLASEGFQHVVALQEDNFYWNNRVSRKPIFFGMPSTVVLSERNPCAGLANPSLHRTRKSGAP